MDYTDIDKTENTSCCGGCCATEAPPAGENSMMTIYLPTIFSFILLVVGMLLAHNEISWFSGGIKLGWFIVAYIPVGWKVLWYAVKNIGRGEIFNEFFLMGIATIGAFCIGEYAEGVAVMLFYVIGEHFQEAAVNRSRKSIKSLIDDRPSRVSVIREGNLQIVPAENVAIGETVQIKAGEKIALDGVLLSEKASFNTAALTGESKPDTKYRDEQVLAGMINLEKVVQVQVTAVFANSTLSKILKLVEDAAQHKAKPQKFITRFAKIYTPIVFFGAVLLTFLPYFFVESYVFQEWLYRALVFLVVSCPCALVVSIPLGYFGGIGAASKNGLLFKGANYLDLITKLDTVVFDKTGTLTEGVFEVQAIDLAGQSAMTKNGLIELTAAIEKQSNHPIAQAIVRYAELLDKNETAEISQVEEISGFGLTGIYKGKQLCVGNGKLLQKYGIDYPKPIEEIPETVVLVAYSGEYVGCFTIADTLKQGSEKLITTLKKQGISHHVMLSGDKQSVVDKVAIALGVEKAYGGLLPQDKLRQFESLKKPANTVAFVGDGINDAPVLATADVGIAMGGLGSDAAIETADVVIQNDQPEKLITAIRIGKKTKQVVWQNIGLAFGVKALILGLATIGIASLWGAVFADVGVALLAILNAVRIQHINFEKQAPDEN